MSRKTILATSVAMFLVVLLFVAVSKREVAPKASDAVSSSVQQTRSPAEVANLTFNFSGIPIAQAIDIYEGWAKQKVAPPQAGWPLGTLHISTPRSLTTNDALRLIEVALKEQSNIAIRHGSDGSLSAEIAPAR